MVNFKTLPRVDAYRFSTRLQGGIEVHSGTESRYTLQVNLRGQAKSRDTKTKQIKFWLNHRASYQSLRSAGPASGWFDLPIQRARATSPRDRVFKIELITRN